MGREPTPIAGRVEPEAAQLAPRAASGLPYQWSMSALPTHLLITSRECRARERDRHPREPVLEEGLRHTVDRTRSQVE